MEDKRDTLVSDAKYPIMINGDLVVREDGRLFHAQTIQIENSFKDYRLDLRTYAVSVFNTLDYDEYMRYYRYVISQMNVKFASINVIGNLPDLLDQGYMPLIMSPTFIDVEKEVVLSYILEQLEKKRIGGQPIICLRQPQYNLGDKVINRDGYDVWVSRMQFASYFKCQPQDVRITEILKFLLS